MAASEASTPPRSRSSSGSLSSRRPSASNLSLDLDSLPPLQQPSPPSNTLIITNLDDPVIFTPANLASIRAAIHNHASLHSFSPLKSFRRIICTFHSEEEAITIRKVLDGESVLGNRVRVYFGEPTRLDTGDQHLAAPQSQKLFFISPPPSPPHGWEMRNEEPPNKDVHADDLAAALSKLHARPAPDEALRSPTEAEMKHAGGRARGAR
ncbi:hypothetical protein H2203_008613 [Taxawa tesnikishii (nom. ined.)]|nr:hypothetical protein H2203_008613 [Dothideales sp. JES 119]